MSNKPSIVFAHGIWADGSCFSKVMKLLYADGYETIATQNPLDTVEGDVAAVRSALGRVSSPSVLVGHSYGGTVITGAGTDERVKALVYICALAPDEGETSQYEQDRHAKTAVFDEIEVNDGRIWMRKSGAKYFCGDLSEEDQRLVWATQVTPAADLFNQPVHGAAWKTKPCHYIVGNNDHAVNPELERFVAKRMNAKITELQSSHVPMLSQPERVYEVIRTAAESVSEAASQRQPVPA